jgi:signal transduction histidine kinase
MVGSVVAALVVAAARSRRPRRERGDVDATGDLSARRVASSMHDAKNALATIRGFGELLERTELTPQQRSYLTQVLRAEAELLRIADSLLGVRGVDPAPVTEELRVRRVRRLAGRV